MKGGIPLWIVLLLGTVFLSLTLPHDARAASSEVLYTSDFSSDPGWVTDEPSHFYWDETKGALFAHMDNADRASTPNRYLYHQVTNFNPRLSYELTWDMYIEDVASPDGDNGVAVFGLYGRDMKNFFTSLFDAFDGSDAMFSTRLMTLDRNSRYVFNELSPDGMTVNLRQAYQRLFSRNEWHTLTLRYDASALTYTFSMIERASGVLIFTNTITVDAGVVPATGLQFIGLSGNPEGRFGTNLGNRPGYAEYLIDNVTLTQIYDETYTEPTSILFLPGIQASRLYKDGLLGTEDQLWEPNINSDVAQLEMTESGESVHTIYTRDVVDSVFGVTDVYGSFMEYLDTLVSQGMISAWEPFAYDWRYPVDSIVEEGTQYETEITQLTTLVEDLARDNNSRVTIIAHSNGGLLAKALISKLEAAGKASLVERIIFVAAPQLGTPKAIGSILHGYDQEHAWGIISEDETARAVIRNMPGAYGLVPSSAYFSALSEPVVRFAPGTTTDRFIQSYGNTIESAEELVNFMVGLQDGRSDATAINEVSKANGDMLVDAQLLHRNVLDSWVAPDGIEVIEIVGVGLDTVKGFEYEEFIERTCLPAGGPGGQLICVEEPYYEPVPLFTQYGDETVVSVSAEAYPGVKRTSYLDLLEVKNSPSSVKVKHADITALPELQKHMVALIQRASSTESFIYDTKPIFGLDRDVISVHSPVTLSLSDAKGGRVGRTTVNGHETVVTDVPGSTYVELGGATYIVVPSGTHYTAHIAAHGETGSYTLTVETLSGEEDAVPLFSLIAATVTPTMQATFSKSVGIFSELSTDYDGDGVVDATDELAPAPTTATLFAALKTMVDGFVNLKAKDRHWLTNALGRAESTGATKGYGSSAVQKIFAQIDAKLVQYESAGKISMGEYNIFISFMEEIRTR